MKCNHCGLCCRDPCTQINLTIGDLYRMSVFLGISVSELFENKAGINPFADPDFIHYDMDLGLNLPCKFRINKRCSIYAARPLNCRLFPYWILAEAPPEKLSDILSEHKCKYDITRKKEYIKYKEVVADILMKESELFKINRKINVMRLRGFNDIDEDNFRQREQAKIILIKQRCNEKVDIEMIKEKIKQNLELIKENSRKLEEAEKILK